MPQKKSISPELARSACEQLAGMPLPPNDYASVAEMVSALLAEMQSMRDLDVGELEPAATYEAQLR